MLRWGDGSCLVVFLDSVVVELHANVEDPKGKDDVKIWGATYEGSFPGVKDTALVPEGKLECQRGRLLLFRMVRDYTVAPIGYHRAGLRVTRTEPGTCDARVG